MLGLADAELLRGLARVLLEVAAQERCVAELIVPRNLLDGVGAGAQQQLQLHHHIVVDDGFGRVVGGALHDGVQVFGRDVESLGIVGHAPAHNQQGRLVSICFLY